MLPNYSLIQWGHIAAMAEWAPATVKMLLGQPYVVEEQVLEWERFTPGQKEIVSELVQFAADFILGEGAKGRSAEQVLADSAAAKAKLEEHITKVGASPDAVGVIFPSHQDVPLERVQDAIDQHERVEAAKAAGEVVGATGIVPTGFGGIAALLGAIVLLVLLR